MATLNVSMSPKVVLASKPALREYETPRLATVVTYVRKGSFNARQGLVTLVQTSPQTPDKLSGSIEQSIKAAQETCADNPETGECAAAWDEVEEVSAAASHARDKSKATDPLETYCKDNPETDECRTYDN